MPARVAMPSRSRRVTLLAAFLTVAVSSLAFKIPFCQGLTGTRGPPPRASSLAREVGHYGRAHNGAHLSASQKAALEEIAEAIGTPGKGITATDEGPLTVGGRFEAVGVENTEENRRTYRQMLYTAKGANKYLSAAILDPETVFQKSDDGVPFPKVCSDLGIVPGVKPHLKIYSLPGTADGETVMQGLDSLAARCKEYREAGCRFAKWRSPLEVSEGEISRLCIEANMHDLARYALICQDEGLVPIVEPDISLKGDHDLETAVRVNVEVQSELYKAMIDHGVFMEGAVLKSNMVNPGKACKTAYTCEEIAQANVEVLQRCMPVSIRTANYLSGGQSLEDASARLNAINRHSGKKPWNLSFSWSAALQLPLLELCKGKGSLQLEEMEELYLKELAIASAAAKGEHSPAAGDGDHTPPP
ncbi:FBPA [Symbiodinium natans]|uniref:fructose-bisphosphate aldolase n=1 Tax=Symbiodinium natans TaxID=878477 RepID=A0A812TDF8_9DINO|nr:FBPA [Symbiodinium natans]